MTLDTIIAEAQRLATLDKGLAYFYLLGILERANEPNANNAPHHRRR